MEHGKEISRDLDIVQELKESYEDLNELVAEEPLNVEVQKMRYNVNISMLKARGIGDLGIFHDERDDMHAKRIFHDERQKCAMEEPGMHPKNIYRYETPNFRQLVDIFPELKQYTIKANDGHAGLDFRNWDACRELVKVQFTHDFGRYQDLI